MFPLKWLNILIPSILFLLDESVLVKRMLDTCRLERALEANKSLHLLFIFVPLTLSQDLRDGNSKEGKYVLPSFNFHLFGPKSGHVYDLAIRSMQTNETQFSLSPHFEAASMSQRNYRNA